MEFAFRGDLALGRYWPGDSVIHRLDPRTKLVAFVVTLAALFFHGPIGTGVWVALVLASTRIARVPFARLRQGLRSMSWILLITLGFHALWIGPTQLGGVVEGLYAGLFMVLRLVGMLTVALVFTATTEPVQLADGLASLFGFLQRFRIPVRSLAMVFTLALRFLPTILEEAERIVMAQKARGARFDGGLLPRARRMLPLAIPLFASCLQRADRLALAMEARGYRDGAPRTTLVPLKFRAEDFGALTTLAALGLVVALTLRGA